MFKKLAIGCGIFVLLAGIVLAGLGYYAYRQVSSSVAQFREFGQVPDLERSIRNRDAFVPPASEELTESQVDKLVQVQTEVRRRVGERMASFEEKYKVIARNDNATIADAPAIIRAYGDLAAAWVDAKRSQVDALNAAGLSLEEYRWIRDQAYRALGLPFVDLDMGRFADESARSRMLENPAELRGSLGPAGPEVNRKRIERVKKLLEENLALASFGL